MIEPLFPQQARALPMSRRGFLRSTALVSAATAIGFSARATAALSLQVLETKVISPDLENYHGWPTLTRRRNGQLVLVWSGGRESHVCPFGRVEMMTSDNNGQTWTWPRVLIDGAIDDRDAGRARNRQRHFAGGLLHVARLRTEPAGAEKKEPGDKGALARRAPAGWQAAHDRLTAEQRRAELGQWMIRSTDGGVTWSARYPTLVNSPHGPIQLSDGRLLYAGKSSFGGKERRVGVCESTDDGASWRWLGDVPERPGDSTAGLSRIARRGNGRWPDHRPNPQPQSKPNTGETLQTESTDGGRTWAVPRSIGVWGLPSFLSACATAGC